MNPNLTSINFCLNTYGYKTIKNKIDMKTNPTFPILCKLQRLSKCFSALLVCCLLLLTEVSFAQEDCDPISTFPWHEGFEDNGTNIPKCWKIMDSGYCRWNVVPDTIGTPPTAHEGIFKALSYQNVGPAMPHVAWIFTPVFDLSAMSIPVLSFWHTQMQGIFEVYYRNSPDGEWVSLKYFYNNPDWQEAILLLPNKSNHYQIRFASFYAGGEEKESHFDDISIFEYDDPAPTHLSLEIDQESRSAIFSWDNDKPALGFSVYLDDEEIETNVQNREFLFTNLTDGNHMAGVRARYPLSFSEIATISFEVLKIDETQIKHYSLSPNPVSELLTIERSAATKEMVKIFNNAGTLVHSFETTEKRVNVNATNYTSGIYFVSFSGSNGTITQKFIKQ